MRTTMTDSTAPNLRILRIFEVIADAGRPLTPTEINEQLDWPKQSLHRLCQTLIAEDYLVKQARRLHPTKRLLGLAAGLTQHAAGQTTRHQILQNIARETGETVNFGFRYRFELARHSALIRVQAQNVLNDYRWQVSSSGGFTYSGSRSYVAQLVMDI